MQRYNPSAQFNAHSSIDTCALAVAGPSININAEIKPKYVNTFFILFTSFYTDNQETSFLSPPPRVFDWLHNFYHIAKKEKCNGNIAFFLAILLF
jgi:hypothetical protein